MEKAQGKARGDEVEINVPAGFLPSDKLEIIGPRTSDRREGYLKTDYLVALLTAVIHDEGFSQYGPFEFDECYYYLDGCEFHRGKYEVAGRVVGTLLPR